MKKCFACPNDFRDKNRSLAYCIEDDPTEQRDCVGYEMGEDEYCRFNYDQGGAITDLCFCPGILKKQEEEKNWIPIGQKTENERGQ